MVNLLHGIHAAVRFGKQTLHVEAILRAERRADAQRNQVTTGNLATRFDSDLIKMAGLFDAGLELEARTNHDELISAHAGDIVVAAAGCF